MVKDILTRKPIVISPNVSLMNALHLFQKGLSHLALITNQVQEVYENLHNNQYQFDANNISILGIITIEDVLEELIQEDIYDEQDISFYNTTRFNNDQIIEENCKKIITQQVGVQRAVGQFKKYAKRARKRIENRLNMLHEIKHQKSKKNHNLNQYIQQVNPSLTNIIEEDLLKTPLMGPYRCSSLHDEELKDHDYLSSYLKKKIKKMINKYQVSIILDHIQHLIMCEDGGAFNLIEFVLDVIHVLIVMN